MSLQRGVGVLGASSLVGLRLLPLLADAGWQVLAFSRQTVESGSGVAWRRLSLAEHPSPQPSPQRSEGCTQYRICVAPIWVLPEYFS
ncbi:MAG: hypothetical protein Q7J21_11105, partial [Rugosibacter sp.]|nr:hypothetical protein [Rugosibacter sp.]